MSYFYLLTDNINPVVFGIRKDRGFVNEPKRATGFFYGGVI